MLIRLFFFLILLAGNVNAQNRRIQFEEGDLAAVLSKAKATNKPVFIDAYTLWCGPCKWMDKNVFTNDTVADYYNAQFVNYKFDMENGEGPAFAKKYGVRAYPSLLYLDGEGNVLHRAVGSRQPVRFIETGKAATDPERQLTGFEKRYVSGEREAEFIRRYLETLTEAGLDADKQADEYLMSQPEGALENNVNWEIFREFVESVDSKAFQYAVEHKSRLSMIYTADSVNAKIGSVYSNTLMDMAYRGRKEDYQGLKSTIEKLNLEEGRKIILMADLVYYKVWKDLENYIVSAVELVEEHRVDDPRQLNSISWHFYKHVSDKKLLEKAERWSAHSVELDPNFYNLDTYASLLYKNGKKQAALDYAVRAIEEGKKAGEDISGTEELKAQIEKMK